MRPRRVGSGCSYRSTRWQIEFFNRIGQKRTFASPLTGNADLKEFLHSRAVDFPRGKKLAHNDLHSRKIQIEDRGNMLYRVAHEVLVLLLREIIVFSNRAPGEILSVSPSIAKNKRAYCCHRTRIIQVHPVNVAGSQQIVLSGEPTARHTPFLVRHDVATASNREASRISFKKFDAI